MRSGQSGKCWVKRPLGWRLAAYPGRCQHRHSDATNGADGSSYAGKATAGIGLRDHGRRGHDLVVGCSVAATPAFAAAACAGRRQRQVASQERRPIETVGAAIADKFERRWQATDDMPLMPVPARDPLEGLIGGTQIGPHDFAPSPQPDQQIPSR